MSEQEFQVECSRNMMRQHELYAQLFLSIGNSAPTLDGKTEALKTAYQHIRNYADARDEHIGLLRDLVDNQA